MTRYHLEGVRLQEIKYTEYLHSTWHVKGA